MKKASILLVGNPNDIISEMDWALKEAGLDYVLHFAGSGKNGLDLLMGDPYHEVITSEDIKMKPNVVILSNNLKDISAVEFLGIIGKYYSLRDTKIFLLSDPLTDAERLAYQDLGINGYLQRPLDKEQVLQQIKPQLHNGEAHRALFPFVFFKSNEASTGLGNLIQNKVIGLYAGLRIAAGIAAVLTLGSVAMYHANNGINESQTSETAKIPEPIKEQIAASDSLAGSASLDQNKQAAKIQLKSVQKEIADLPVSSPDTLKSFPKENDPVPDKKSESLRIVVIEEPDSLHHE